MQKLCHLFSFLFFKVSRLSHPLLSVGRMIFAVDLGQQMRHPLPFFPTEPRSPFHLLRAAASTSVSALSSHRIWPHTLCDFVTANMCVCFRQRVKKSGKICVHLCANMRVCLLCFMYDIDNLEATGGRDLEKKEGARSLAWTMWGRWVSGNAISFWSSSSSKQTLWAMPPG